MAAATSPSLPPDQGRPGNGAASVVLDRLFKAHHRMVLGLCRLLLRDPHEAEDAAQQVFLSAHRAVASGAVPRDGAAWLAAIARNECRARIRARMRAPLELPEVADDLPDPLATAIHRADLDAVWAALSELPRRQRKAFLLRELGGLSYGELGVALGVTRPAVESLLFRARQQLRESAAAVSVLPATLREQLAQLFQGLGGAGASLPVAAKVAAVTAGIGLGAAGIVTLPRHTDARDTRSHRSSLARVGSSRVGSLASTRDAQALVGGHASTARAAGGRGRTSGATGVLVRDPGEGGGAQSSSGDESQPTDSAGTSESSGPSAPPTADDGSSGGNTSSSSGLSGEGSSGESGTSGESGSSGDSGSSGASGSTSASGSSGESGSGGDSGSSGESTSGSDSGSGGDSGSSSGGDSSTGDGGH